MDLKTFWKKGIVEMTPVNQLYAKLWGVGGGIVGLVLALVYLTVYGYWYVDVYIAFALVVQVVEYIGLNQQYKNLKGLMEGQNGL